MARTRKSLLTRLETLAQFALNAFPARYCRSSTLQDPDSPAAFIAECSRQEFLNGLAAMPVVRRAIVVFVWPPAMVLLAGALTLANGIRIERRYHRSIARQFAEQMRLTFVHGVSPALYYYYELHEPENRLRVHEYVMRAQLKRGGNMYKRLYRECPQRRHRASILNNKIAFAQFSRDRHLPTPRLFGIVENGIFRRADAEDKSLPRTNLFIKPSNENGGDGAERWTYDDGVYRGKDRRQLSEPELSRHLARASRRAPLLIQECLVNHPELRDLTAGALSTLRIYTFLNEAGEVEHIFSMLRMSRDSRRIVDNVCRGGLAAKVDPATGTIGPATDSGTLARTGWLDRHPFTGAPLSGRPIPFWREALALAISAHREIEAPFMVGWDIAITAAGPVIVEGNKAPDVDIEQRLSGPWGNQRFGELLAYHLKNAMRDIAVSPP